jgi:hypothetical protein
MGIKKALTAFGWPILLIPTLVMWIGSAMNETAVWTNGGQMPVSTYACELKLNPPAEPENILQQLFGAQAHQKDLVHKCADANTKFRALDDWILDDDGVSSLGDVTLDLATAIVKPCFYVWLAYAIVEVIRRLKKS